MKSTMRAILFQSPGHIRLLDGLPVPEPREGEVLIQCTHAGLCGTNMGPYLGEGRWSKTAWPAPPGWMGHENVGIIVSSRYSEWPTGTFVLAQAADYNGFVEFFTAKPAAMARLPADARDPGAFLLAQPLATILRALAKTEPATHQRCAVVGQGPIGLMFTYLLRRAGADQVIAIDRVPWRLEWSRRFGATHVVDASASDTVEEVRRLTDGKMVDVCVEAGSTPQALITAAHLPRRAGRLFAFGVPHDDLQPFPWYHTVTNETRIITSHGPGCLDYFQTAVNMMADGCEQLADLVTPRVPWDQAAEAFANYADPARAKGSLKTTLLF